MDKYEYFKDYLNEQLKLIELKSKQINLYNKENYTQEEALEIASVFAARYYLDSVVDGVDEALSVIKGFLSK